MQEEERQWHYSARGISLGTLGRERGQVPQGATYQRSELLVGHIVKLRSCCRGLRAGSMQCDLGGWRQHVRHMLRRGQQRSGQSEWRVVHGPRNRSLIFSFLASLYINAQTALPFRAFKYCLK